MKDKKTKEEKGTPLPPKLVIKQWSEEDRPREKLMRMGADSLSNAELLAILIGSGSHDETAVGLMKRLLADCDNNLRELGRKSLADLMKYKGIGEVKAVTIKAACEIGKRRQMEKASERKSLNSPLAVYEFMYPYLPEDNIEKAWILLMDNKYGLIKMECISQGGLSETAVDVRVILREALCNNATIVTLCHNHPSGNPYPSGDDDRLTKELQKACATMRLYFADHVIVADGRYYSYMEKDRL